MKNSDYTYTYFIDSLEQAKVTSAKLVQSVGQDEFLLRPAPKKWSMGEILSHLVQAGNEYLPQIKKGFQLTNEKPVYTNESFTPNGFFRYFVKMVSPENRIPLPTVPSFKPLETEKVDQEKTLGEFHMLQDELIALLKSGQRERLDLDKLKTWNPILQIAPMSLTACFAILDAHQRRHFQQMKNIREEL